MLAAETPSAARAMALAREAASAAEAQDNATYLAKMDEAVALRPDFPRMLVNLAAAQLANDRADDALATLNRLAALGFSSPVEKAPEFAALAERKEFKDVVKKLAANLHPKGSGNAELLLREVTGLIEGIAWRAKTGEFYFGDVNARAVWTRNKDGTLKRFTPEGDELFGVFGLAVDEDAGALWAATSAVPAMRGFTSDMDGTAALAEIDLASGAVRRVIPLVRKPGDQYSHVLGDLALGPDGSVFVTDSGGPILWRLPPGGTTLEAFVEHPEFMSVQGIAVVATGSALIVSDHANGLLRVDLASRRVVRLESPPNTSLIGLDGLVAAPNGDVFAIQNGLRPNRVLRIALDAAAETVEAVTVVESGHHTMAAPSLGCIGPEGHLYFIGNAGWTRFENTDGAPSAPRTVPIFRTKLEAPRKK
jgi:sugar lactone lactonase YvrE